MENSKELALLWRWYDNEPNLGCAVFTGVGDSAFGPGETYGRSVGQVHVEDTAKGGRPAGSRFGLLNRDGKKPIVVACDGHVHGAGMEAILNGDVVFAAPNTTFQLPDPRKGSAAISGLLPRAFSLLGSHRALDLMLSGRVLTAEGAVSWGLVKEIVPGETLLERAAAGAESIASMNPDRVIIARKQNRAVRLVALL
ncbi:hypothetical protein PV10_04428 [Exophiala mesophila]|uniref:Enoyl-CoA hydratase n=1 Tax=Exophiala mesophila TaxID=212818 RepID=A0A0D1XY79_EXOME|nr:uncharacterized protein PV10_04428 [Exophiala mesophila]KIV93191.1 hypothetical protein PV10_04428 [Exophiala mesophila]